MAETNEIRNEENVEYTNNEICDNLQDTLSRMAEEERSEESDGSGFLKKLILGGGLALGITGAVIYFKKRKKKKPEAFEDYDDEEDFEDTPFEENEEPVEHYADGEVVDEKDDQESEKKTDQKKTK